MKSDDTVFVRSIETSVLPPEAFDHRAHLRLAFLMISKKGLEKALDVVPRLIQNYVRRWNADDKYHHTLTLAAVCTVHHFMCKNGSADFEALVADEPRLLSGFRPLILSHYSGAVISSSLARRQFVPPDLLPYPIY